MNRQFSVLATYEQSFYGFNAIDGSSKSSTSPLSLSLFHSVSSVFDMDTDWWIHIKRMM